MTQTEHEPIETARPPLAGGDMADAMEPEALESESDDRPPEKQPPSEPPEPD
jgi:hypothetical protein